MGRRDGVAVPTRSHAKPNVTPTKRGSVFIVHRRRIFKRNQKSHYFTRSSFLVASFQPEMNECAGKTFLLRHYLSDSGPWSTHETATRAKSIKKMFSLNQISPFLPSLLRSHTVFPSHDFSHSHSTAMFVFFFTSLPRRHFFSRPVKEIAVRIPQNFFIRRLTPLRKLDYAVRSAERLATAKGCCRTFFASAAAPIHQTKVESEKSSSYLRFFRPRRIIQSERGRIIQNRRFCTVSSTLFHFQAEFRCFRASARNFLSFSLLG